MPVLALIIPGIIGFVLSLTGEGDLMITVAVFGATLSYALMMLSHIILRMREPNMERPYRTPGGVVTSGVALLLSIIAFTSTFVVNLEAAMWSGIFVLLMMMYFFAYSRHHLVAQAPEEEFAAIAKAESDLD